MTGSIKTGQSGLFALKRSPSWQVGLLLAITLLAATMRFYKLGEWSFWLDEIYTISRAQIQYSSLEAVIHNMPPRSYFIPPSFILTGVTLSALGTSEWSARLVSAIIGVISVPVLYFPIKRSFGTGVGLIASLLLAVAPWHLFWSQNARFYTSLMLFYTLALGAFFRGLERDRPGYLLLSLFLLYLAASERLFALFMVPVVVCYLLLLRILKFDKPAGLRARNLVLLSLPAVAAVLLEIYQFITTGTSVAVYEAAHFVGRAIDSPARLLILIGFNIGVPLVSLALFSGVYGLLRKDRRILFLLTGAVVPPLLLAAMNPFMFTVDRYVFAVLPCWIILAAVGVEQVFTWAQGDRKVLAAGILFLLVAHAAGENLMYYQINQGDRLDWRAAFKTVQEIKAENDIIVSGVPEIGIYYTGEEIVPLGNIEPDAVLASKDKYWFVIDSQHSWWSGRQKTWVEENCALMEYQYLRMREKIDLSIYLCDQGKRDPG